MIDSMRMGFVAAVGCFAIASYAGETPAWVQKSNEAAKPLLEYITKYTPEYGSSIGIDQADEGVVDLKPNLYTRSKEDGEKIIHELQAEEASESDPKVRRDLEILITAQKNSLETARLNQELMLPLHDAPEPNGQSYPRRVYPEVFERADRREFSLIHRLQRSLDRQAPEVGRLHTRDSKSGAAWSRRDRRT